MLQAVSELTEEVLMKIPDKAPNGYRKSHLNVKIITCQAAALSCPVTYQGHGVQSADTPLDSVP